MNNITHQKISDKEFVISLAKEISRKGGCVYFVGGFVRDQILNRSNKDIDIEVHGISQDRLVNILHRFGRVDLQGKSFGVFRVGKFDIDISQPRREIKTGDKHTDFDVEVDPFMGTEEAAKRRDFTINALMQNVLTGEIIDHFGGLEDLKNGIIRHVSDDTFAEDALRVLRAAQFSAKFNFDIAPETKAIMTSLDLSLLPRERVNEEMKKAFLKAGPAIQYAKPFSDSAQIANMPIPFSRMAFSTAVSGRIVCQSLAYFAAYSLSQNSGHF
jgi:tRNA nucleotidyltransferase/poly(A) polymerase